MSLNFIQNSIYNLCSVHDIDKPTRPEILNDFNSGYKSKNRRNLSRRVVAVQFAVAAGQSSWKTKP